MASWTKDALSVLVGLRGNPFWRSGEFIGRIPYFFRYTLAPRLYLIVLRGFPRPYVITADQQHKCHVNQSDWAAMMCYG